VSTRATLLDTAAQLFRERGLAGVSIAEIAEAADCFPSQVTYYFGDKESLFVEAACRDILSLRDKVEEAARGARTPQDTVRAMVRAATQSEAILGFVEAMLLARRRDDLQPTVSVALESLHARAEHAAADILALRDWVTPVDPGVLSRAFWSAIIGVALERAATGEAFDERAAEEAVGAVLGFPERG
jgi:AcrR family transcriptional regulator